MRLSPAVLVLAALALVDACLAGVPRHHPAGPRTRDLHDPAARTRAFTRLQRRKPPRSSQGRALARAAERLIATDQAVRGGYFLVHDRAASRVRALRKLVSLGWYGKLTPDTFEALARRAGAGGVPAVIAGGREVWVSAYRFVDSNSREVVEVDLWAALEGGRLDPVFYAIRQVDAEERFRYRPDEVDWLR